MREILTEDPDFESSAHGSTLVKSLSQLQFIDSETNKLIWQGHEVERSFFGNGILDLDEKSVLEQDEMMQEAYNQLIKAFITAGIKYQLNSDQDPHRLIASSLLDEFYASEKCIWDDEQINSMWDFLSGMIECETLAPWLLVSKVSF